MAGSGRPIVSDDMRGPSCEPRQAGRAWRVAFGCLALLAGLADVLAADVPYYFGTYAGTPSIGADDGPAAAARFNNPEGLAFDAVGNLYVADTGNRLVRKVSPDGTVSTVAGTVSGIVEGLDGPAASARFALNSAVAVDRSGAIFVADIAAIRRMSPDGKVTTFAGKSGDGTVGTGLEPPFNRLQALALNRDGLLLVSDDGNSLVRQVTPGAAVTTLAGSGQRGDVDGTGSAAGFYHPAGLAVDAAGVVYVADSGNNTIRRITPAGSVTTVAGAPGIAGSDDGVGVAARFNHPEGVAVDATGRLVVADTFNQTLRTISPEGQVSTLAGHPLTTAEEVTDGIGAAGTFGTPNGIALDAAGNAYVSDSICNTIRKVTPSGVVTTVAGLAPNRSAGAVDGDRPAARFFQPQGIAVAADGTCYVADTSNQVIRRISPAGIVTTLAGLAGQSGYANGTGAEARFSLPTGLAVDATGNVFVIDSNRAVRKITPAGVVTTLAGAGPGTGIPSDGTGAGAVFYFLSAIAVDPGGNVWVAEISRFDPLTGYRWARVHRITPTGVVTTVGELEGGPHVTYTGLAVDAAGLVYACDPNYSALVRLGPDGVKRTTFAGTGRIAFAPAAVVISPSGQVFLTDLDFGNCRIALLKPDDQLEIIGGGSYQSTHRDGLGTEALFNGVTGIGVDGAGAIYVACTDNTIRKGVPAAAPGIVVQPNDQTVAAGASVLFSVKASGVPDPTYQWYLNGTPIPQATGASYGLKAAGAADAGDYSVTITNSLGSVTSNKAALKITASTQPPPGGDAGAGGGGGAVSGWFLGALAVLGGLKATSVRRRAALGQQL